MSIKGKFEKLLVWLSQNEYWHSFLIQKIKWFLKSKVSSKHFNQQCFRTDPWRLATNTHDYKVYWCANNQANWSGQYKTKKWIENNKFKSVDPQKLNKSPNYRSWQRKYFRLWDWTVKANPNSKDTYFKSSWKAFPSSWWWLWCFVNKAVV